MVYLNSKTIKLRRKLVLLIIFLLALAALNMSSSLLLTSGRLSHPLDSPPQITGIEGVTTYTPKFTAKNFKESMTLTPIFTPDNAIDVYAAWIDRATSTIDIQNQYLTQFDDAQPWSTDPNPIVRGIVDAVTQRSVTVRVQFNEGGDSDDITAYFQTITGIEVRWMGKSAANPDGEYLSNTHNKLVIIDGEVVIISSINFSENAFTNNREAGMVIQSETAADYFTNVFESDWADGEVPPGSSAILSTNQQKSSNALAGDYPSHTDIPDTNFTGTYNITLFANPDNADDVIFRYLESAQTSIYVSMYTISREDFTDTLVALKNANPSLDIQVLISYRRVGGSENVDTKAAAEELVANLIPVYNSTKDDDKVDGFYHAKYWLVDGKHTFVYSGNWSPRSVTPQLAPGDTSYSSGDPNRDMGVAVHDAPDVASHFKDVWDADVAVGSAWELPIGIKQGSFSTGEVISGAVTLSAQVAGLEGATLSYRWGEGSWTAVGIVGTFSKTFNTTTLPNGITTFEVKAETGTQTFTDKVKVNVVNISPHDNWRVLITEVIPDPSDVSDDEGEFIELTNSFPFAILLEDWQVGDDNDLYTFGVDYKINAYSSLIIARSLSGFQGAYETSADIELDFALTNSGDYAQLIDPKGEYADVVAFGSATAPDNSEVLPKPGAGESLHRTTLSVDTNAAADFSIGLPDPKGTVPQDPLRTTPLETSAAVTSAFWIAFFAAIIILPVVRRKWKNRE